MKTIELSSNQALKLFHGETLRIRRKGKIYYIEKATPEHTKYGEPYTVSTWMGGELPIKLTGIY